MEEKKERIDEIVAEFGEKVRKEVGEELPSAVRHHWRNHVLSRARIAILPRVLQENIDHVNSPEFKFMGFPVLRAGGEDWSSGIYPVVLDTSSTPGLTAILFLCDTGRVSLTFESTKTRYDYHVDGKDFEDAERKLKAEMRATIEELQGYVK